MQYLMWRVMAGLNKTVEMSFLLVGHTKFAPDWCFGLLKRKFRKSLVGCLNDMLRVVDQSAKTNVAELVGKEDGTTLIPQYDWAGFFERRMHFVASPLGIARKSCGEGQLQCQGGDHIRLEERSSELEAPPRSLTQRTATSRVVTQEAKVPLQ